MKKIVLWSIVNSTLFMVTIGGNQFNDPVYSPRGIFGSLLIGTMITLIFSKQGHNFEIKVSQMITQQLKCLRNKIFKA